MDAEAFFARLRSRRPTTTVDVPPPPPAREAPSLDRFGNELAAIGGALTRVKREEVAATVARLARERSVKSFVAARTPLVEELSVRARLVEAGVKEIERPADASHTRAVLAEAELGVVEAELALAESGSIGLGSAGAHGRLVSALPPRLVVLLEEKRLLLRIDDMPAWIDQHGLPAQFSLITGVSCTGDIDSRLIVGAQGPAELHVVAFA